MSHIHNSMTTNQPTKEQELIARLSWDSCLLVLAGPGTGKTYTLIHRLKHLILNEGLHPFNDLLVLSFSRAAVSEIRSRTAALVSIESFDDFRYLDAWTFDSFATRLMIAAEKNSDLSGLNYDARISLAVKELMDTDSIAKELLSGYRHIIVDEIQDLVGVRARLVLSVLDCFNGGFTLLGDPAQGIYDFLARDSDYGPTSDEFLSRIRNRWQGRLIEMNLSQNIRSSGQIAQLQAEIRPLALENDGNSNTKLQKIRKAVLNLENGGTVKAPNKELLSSENKRVAILCRTNAEALYTSNSFRRSGLSTIIPVSNDEKGLPVWIGRTLSKYVQPMISETTFAECWDKNIGRDYDISPSTAWNLLKGIEGRDAGDLDLDLLRSRLRKGINWTFESESQKNHNNILVTTIHQAKGREYDYVGILLPDIRNGVDERVAIEETRTLYVAATRAKERLFMLDRSGIPAFDHPDLPSRNQRQVAIDRRNVHYFEFGFPGDIRELSYVDNSLFINKEQVDKIQDLLWSSVKPGDPLHIQADISKGGLRYVIMKQFPKKQIPLAVVDNNFQLDLQSYISELRSDTKAGRKSMMDGIIVAERKTVILPPYDPDIFEPYATSRFCIGLTIKGLIQID